MADQPRRGVDSKFLITLLVGLALQAAGVIWWASNLQSAVQHNDFFSHVLVRLLVVIFYLLVNSSSNMVSTCFKS